MYGEVTLIVPFYRNGLMLQRQLEEWGQYPSGVHIIVVDDGSPEPAEPVVEANLSGGLRQRLELYRILVDTPWNREEARNLGTAQAKTQWVVHVDIDHLLPAASAQALLEFSADAQHWYRFSRWRKGRADETRQKDALDPQAEFGRIKPHIDSFLITRDLYWTAGGYDLAFAGCLGGGTEFLKRLEAITEPHLLPDPIALHVYTRSEVLDASDWSLSRDRTEGKRRAQRLAKNSRTRGAVLSPWERQL